MRRYESGKTPANGRYVTSLGARDGRSRQRDGEAGSAAWDIGDRHRSAEGFGERGHDRQAESGPTGVSRSRCVAAREALEYM